MSKESKKLFPTFKEALMHCAEQMLRLADSITEGKGRPFDAREKGLVRQAYKPVLDELVHELQSGFLCDDDEYICTVLDDLDRLRRRLVKL